MMPRESAIIFRDLIGKPDVLNVECEKMRLPCSLPPASVDRAVRRRRQAVCLDGLDYRGLPTEAGDEPQRYVRYAMPDLPKVV